MRARRVPCVRARRFLRASEAQSLACKQGLISCVRTLNLERHSVLWASHSVARNVCCIYIRTLPCRLSRVAGRVAGRGSINDRWPMAAGCGSLARAPRYRRAERLLCRRSGGVARLPCRQRHSDHHHFRCVVPCRSTRIVRNRAKSCPCQLEDNAFRRSVSCVRARCVRCVRCERGERTLNLERHSVLWAPHYIARNVYCIYVRTLPCCQRVNGRGSRLAARGSRVDGRWSMVDGRWSMVDGRWSMAAGRGSRVAGRGSIARVPRYRRAERLLLRRRSDSVRGTVFHVVSGIGPPPFPMRGPMSIDGLSEIEQRSPVCAIVRQRIPSLDLLRASAARPFARERGAISWVRARRDLLYATLRSKSVHVFGRPCASSVALVPHCRRARSVYYVDILAVWHVSRVISGMWANTISDVWSHVDRRGSWRVSRGTALLLHHLGDFWCALRGLVLMY